MTLFFDWKLLFPTLLLFLSMASSQSPSTSMTLGNEDLSHLQYVGHKDARPPHVIVRIGSSVGSDDWSEAFVNDRPTLVENEYFSGSVMVRVANFHGYVPHGEHRNDQSHFQNKKRLFEFAFEGELKQPLNGYDLVFGADFERPIHRPPLEFIIMRAVRLIDPCLNVDLKPPSPSVTSPFLCAMTALNLETGIEDQDAMLQKFSAQQRRHHFTNQKHLKSFQLPVGTIIKAGWFAPHLDLAQFEMRLGLRLQLSKHLNKQPIRFSLRLRDKSATLFTIEFRQV